MTAETRQVLQALIQQWHERRNEICRTLDRCDSAKAFEVQRCAKELAAALQAEPSTLPTNTAYAVRCMRDVAAFIDRLCDSADAGASWESAGHLRRRLTEQLRTVARGLDTNAKRVADAAAEPSAPGGAALPSDEQTGGSVREWILNYLRERTKAKPSALIQYALRRWGIDGYEIRETVWGLLCDGSLELTADRFLRLAADRLPDGR